MADGKVYHATKGGGIEFTINPKTLEYIFNLRVNSSSFWKKPNELAIQKFLEE